MKKSKRSQKKRKRPADGGQQRQTRPVLSDDEYTGEPGFERPGGPPLRRPDGQVGSSRLPPGGPSPRQDAQERGGQAPAPGAPRQPQSQDQPSPSSSTESGTFRAMSRTGAGRQRPGPTTNGPSPQAGPTRQAGPARQANPTRQANPLGQAGPGGVGPAGRQPGVPSGQRQPARRPIPNTAAGLPDMGEHAEAFRKANPAGAATAIARPQGPPQGRNSVAPGPGQRQSGTAARRAPANASQAPRDRGAGPAGSGTGPETAATSVIGQAPPAKRPSGPSLAAAGGAAAASRLAAAGPKTEAFQMPAPSGAPRPGAERPIADAATRADLGTRKAIDTATKNRPSQSGPQGTRTGRPSDTGRTPEQRPGRQRPAGGTATRGKKPLPANSRRAPKKPSEPTKIVMALAVAAIVLAGVGVSTFFFMRDGGDTSTANETAEEGAQETLPVDQQAQSGAGDPAQAAEPTAGGPLLTVANEAAAIGPLESGVAYEILTDGVPGGAELTYVIDGQPAGDSFSGPAPPLTLEPGRRTVALQQDLGGEISVGPAIAVYVLGGTPGRSYRANLKSVNVETEGWAEAVTQFDLIRQDHPDLKLTPSDPYPSLTPGFWNLYVDGFSSSEEALAYCETSGLAVPDQCFAKLFDPTAPAP